jgi:hypothetical protein
MTYRESMLEQLNHHLVKYDEALKQGQISKEEYVELLKGINIMESIADDADGLELKEQLNVMINAAISAASLMA